jgi:hypothetical protein
MGMGTAQRKINMEQKYKGVALTTLVLGVEVYVTFVNHLCSIF